MSQPDLRAALRFTIKYRPLSSPMIGFDIVRNETSCRLVFTPLAGFSANDPIYPRVLYFNFGLFMALIEDGLGRDVFSCLHLSGHAAATIKCTLQDHGFRVVTESGEDSIELAATILDAPLRQNSLVGAESVILDQKIKPLQEWLLKTEGRVLMTGTQALVRMPMLQRERDRAAGLNTARFVSGYRGSPLGGIDNLMARSGKALAAHDITFQPGLNEELAATSLWGTQQIDAQEGATVDGALTQAVARNLAMLMTYKDEYEVARFYASPVFRERLAGNLMHP